MNDLLKKLLRREVGYYDIRHLRLDGAELEEFEAEIRADERRKIEAQGNYFKAFIENIKKEAYAKGRADEKKLAEVQGRIMFQEGRAEGIDDVIKFKKAQLTIIEHNLNFYEKDVTEKQEIAYWRGQKHALTKAINKEEAIAAARHSESAGLSVTSVVQPLSVGTTASENRRVAEPDAAPEKNIRNRPIKVPDDYEEKAAARRDRR